MIWLVAIVLIGVVVAKSASAARAENGNVVNPAPVAGGDYAGYTLAQLTRTSSGIANEPTAAALVALQETAARMRLTELSWPNVKWTSVYRSKAVTAAIWPYYPRQPPSWDYHQKGQAADASGIDLDSFFDWCRQSGLWTGADGPLLERSANHVHLSWA